MKRYSKILQQPTTEETLISYYKNPYYQSIPFNTNDIYVITTDGDRYDKLALQYYSDPTLWWIISIGNDNLPQNTLNVPIGLQIRIPRDVSNIMVAYNKLNS